MASVATDTRGDRARVAHVYGERVVSKGPWGVIGPGRLGSVLASALCDAGHEVRVHARSERAQDLATRLPGALVRSSAADLVADVEVVVIATGDDAVHGVAASLPVSAHHAVVHCSGALPLSALSPCAQRGAQTACFHPLQSFPDRRMGAERFDGVAIGIEASASALYGRLATLATQLGATPLSLAGVDRARYHAAAVLASNCLIGLLQTASQTWTSAGLPSDAALPALLPLARGAMDAAAGQSLAEALTGPLCRGDVATVAGQLAALSTTPELRAVYAALSRQLLTLGKPDDKAAGAELAALLAEKGP